MTSPPETTSDHPTAPAYPAGRSRVTSVLLTAGLLILIVGVLAYLMVLAQPFTDATGGCGGG
jgi:hypothetical protein